MDREDWELAFEPLEKNSYQVLKAMTVLTQFHDVGFNLFLKFSEGQLTIEEEHLLGALGVKL